MQQRRRRTPIADSIRERQQKQRADELAAQRRIADDAAALNSAPALPTASIDQPVVNEREREAAFAYLPHYD